MADAEACVNDLVHLLRNYEQGVTEILHAGVEAAEERDAEAAEQLTTVEEKAVTRLCAEDGQRVEEAQVRYLGALAVEHQNWFKRETDIADSQVASRKYELEVVERLLAEQGVENLQEALHERCEQHLALLTPGIETSSSENRFVQAERARQEWTTEVCKAVIMEMRKEWRMGQRKALQQLAGELRAERKAAADALERQILMSRKVSDTVKGMWANEIQEAQEELDQVAESYKKALKCALEAKLREARQHAKEQAEFFQKEIREALLFETQEQATRRSQLRRMRLAMLKWRFDYTADAKKKAAELAARGILGKLKQHGRTAADMLSQEPEQAAKKEARKQEKKAQKEEAKAKAKAEAAGKSKAKAKIVTASSKVKFGDDDDAAAHADDHESGGSSTEESTSDEEAAELPADFVPDRHLADCRIVMERLWSRLSTAPQSSRDFLFKLEELVPFEEEILIMYEEELQRHGVVCALDATDGRAEEALQAEREAAAAVVEDTVEEVKQPAPKKKNVKPAVPTVKRRVNLMQ